ncbi:hypothetical protein BD626DRAFT_506597, partial [Schizophyllum amplum]
MSTSSSGVPVSSTAVPNAASSSVSISVSSTSAGPCYTCVPPSWVQPTTYVLSSSTVATYIIASPTASVAS